MGSKERFVEYLKFKGIGQTAFEKKAGLARGTIAKKNGFNADSLEKIISICTDLNSEWLLIGKGEMLKNTSENPEMEVKLPEVTEIDKNDMSVVQSLLSLIKEQGKTIKEMATNKDEKHLEEQAEIKNRIEGMQDVLKGQAEQMQELFEKLNEIIYQSSSNKNVG